MIILLYFRFEIITTVHFSYYEDKYISIKISIIIAGLLLAITSASLAKTVGVPFPDAYRNWLLVKSMLIQPGHDLENPFQGIHHVYANSKAANGLKTGNYKDGSILVFGLIKHEEKDKTIQEGKRKLVGVVHKDSA